jgi:hypothetical protein
VHACVDGVAMGMSSDSLVAINGHVNSGLSSELVSLCRYLLDSSHQALSGGSASWSHCLRGALQLTLSGSLATQRDHKDLASKKASGIKCLGAVSILGGYSEPLRIGGVVRVDTGDSTRPKAIVVDYSDTSPYARIVYVSELNGSGVNVSVHRVRACDVTPVPEYHVKLTDFPLSESILSILQQTIDTPSPVSNSSQPHTHTHTPAGQHTSDTKQPPSSHDTKVDSMSDGDTEDSHVYDWLVSELKWRSIAVLESLIANSDALDNVDDGMFKTIGDLFIRHSLSCPTGLNLQVVSFQADRLRERLWDIKNNVDNWFAPMPLNKLPSTSGTSAKPAGTVNEVGECVYGVSSYAEEKRDALENDDAMLKYWDKHIIPSIQNYVKGSFKPYEMENFFAQLRQPLKQNNNSQAVEIAYTLCGGHVPDGVTFPDENKDFHTLMIEDVGIGHYYQVTADVTRSEIYVEGMKNTLWNVGRVKAVHPGEELVLLQFYDEKQAVLDEWWYPVEVLVKPPSGSRGGQLDRVRDKFDVQCRLADGCNALCSLIARRAIFSLFSRTQSRHDLLHLQYKSDGLNKLLQYIILSASEALNLADLTHLGEATGTRKDFMFSLETNVANVLQGIQANKSHPSEGDSDDRDVCQLVINQFKSLLETSAKFTLQHTTYQKFTMSPNDTAEWVGECISVREASSLVILFSKDIRLPKGCSLSVYADENASVLIKSYAGTDSASVSLSPLIVPYYQCWVHLTRPSETPARAYLKIIPVHPSLGLAFWLVDFMLTSAINCCQEYGEGGATGLCYQFCQLILNNYSLDGMNASPLKESILRLISKLLTKINEFRNLPDATNPDGAGKAADDANGLPPRTIIIRQVSSIKLQSESESLNRLRRLNDEMVALFKQETLQNVFTSYLQQLVDLMVVSDSHRPIHDRICSHFEFQLPSTDDDKTNAKAAAVEESVESEWACEVCTFANPQGDIACSICGSPKPKAAPKKSAGAGDGSSSGSGDSSQMFHDMMALVSSMRYLIGDEQVDSQAVKAMMQAAWQESKQDKIEKRLFVVENVPSGRLEAQQQAIARAIHAVNPSIRVNAEDIYVGIDPSKPEIAPPIKEDVAKKKEKTYFSFKRANDENGILFYLGTAGQTAAYKNPHELGVVTVTSSSIDTDTASAPVTVLLNRSPARFSTKSTQKQWIQLEFHVHPAILLPSSSHTEYIAP